MLQQISLTTLLLLALAPLAQAQELLGDPPPLPSPSIAGGVRNAPLPADVPPVLPTTPRPSRQQPSTLNPPNAAHHDHPHHHTHGDREPPQALAPCNSPYGGIAECPLSSPSCGCSQSYGVSPTTRSCEQEYYGCPDGSYDARQSYNLPRYRYVDHYHTGWGSHVYPHQHYSTQQHSLYP